LNERDSETPRHTRFILNAGKRKKRSFWRKGQASERKASGEKEERGEKRGEPKTKKKLMFGHKKPSWSKVQNGSVLI